MKRFCDLSQWKTLTGEADIDVSEAVYTGFILLLTIANGAANAFIDDCWVYFDLSQATTGFGAVNTTETIQLAAARKVDGTNYRVESNSDGDGVTPAVTGTNAAAYPAMFGIHVGPIAPAEDCRIYVKLSAETGGDCALPYRINYRGPVPTITAVAAA